MNMKLNFNDPTIRENIIKGMKEVEKKYRKEMSDSVKKRILTNPALKIVWDYVQTLGYKEGAWYRPPHNDIVTTAGHAISKELGLSDAAKLMYMMHDAGNSMMKIAPVTKGADWENPDKRFKHAEIGKYMLATTIGILEMQGLISLPETQDLITSLEMQGLIISKKNNEDSLYVSKDEINKMLDATLIHDYPYVRNELVKKGVIEKPSDVYKLLDTDQKIALRSADRTFVPSALSFWKDLISHYADEGYLKRASELGFENNTVNPVDFGRARLAFFYRNSEEVPDTIDKTIFGFDENLAKYNEGGFCEPCYTKSEKDIVDHMLIERASEIKFVEKISHLDSFVRMFEKAYLDEFDFLLKYAKNEK